MAISNCLFLPRLVLFCHIVIPDTHVYCHTCVMSYRSTCVHGFRLSWIFGFLDFGPSGYPGRENPKIQLSNYNSFMYSPCLVRLIHFMSRLLFRL